MKPPATPREWIAPLRHRYTQLFDELGIEVRWDVPASWIVPPSALQCLALTRLIEEGLTNVISTAAPGASRCAWRSPTPALELMVEDDGAGFDVAAVCQAGISVGMRSMSTRIARVGGSLRIDSAPGRTRLTASLTLEAEDAEAAPATASAQDVSKIASGRNSGNSATHLQGFDGKSHYHRGHPQISAR